MKGMGMFALKRYGSNKDSDPRHHFSVVSIGNWSVSATAELPFFAKDELVVGGGCDGLVYFQGQYHGTIVVCNLKTETWKVLHLPKLAEAKVVDVPSRDGTSTHKKRIRNYYEMEATGLGYDAESKDYKLIRMYAEYIDDESDDEEPGSAYAGCREHAELYSFKTSSWEPIKTPDASILYPIATYCQGSCYWSAILEPTFGGLPDDYDECREYILSFNFSTNTFDHLSFPKAEESDRLYCRVVEHQGSLGALLYWEPEDSSPLIVKLYVSIEATWCMLYNLSCENVERPVGMAESDDGPILLLEGKHDSETSQLLAYDLLAEELEELGIFDSVARMMVIPFVPTEYQLPGCEPMLPFYSYYSEEKPVRKNLEFMKRSESTGSKIMRKKLNTVSSSSKYSVTARPIEEHD